MYSILLYTITVSGRVIFEMHWAIYLHGKAIQWFILFLSRVKAKLLIIYNPLDLLD